MVEYIRRAQKHGIGLCVAYVGSFKYVKFERVVDGQIIYSRSNAPLSGKLTELYKRFEACVTPEDGEAITSYKGEREGPALDKCMAVHDKLRELTHNMT